MNTKSEFPENINSGVENKIVDDSSESLVRKTDNKSEEKEKVIEETPETRIARGFSTFGIQPEQLEEVPGFKDLGEDRKEMVLENLRQITLGRIQTEAVADVREKTAEAGFLGKLWRGIFKNYYSAEAEKRTAKEIMGGGMETHGEILKDLVQKTAESGVSFSPGDDRFTVTFQFTNDKMFSELKTNEAFHMVANDLIRSKNDWEYKDKKNKKTEQIQQQYEETRNQLLEELKGKIGEEKAIAMVWDIDRKVKFQQLFNRESDAEKELQKIESQHVWWKALKNTAVEKGAYMAMGGIARTVTIGLMGVVGAPLAAMGMGAWVARSRAIKSFKEDALLARSGELDAVSTRFTNEELISFKKEAMQKQDGKIDEEELKNFVNELTNNGSKKQPKPNTVLNVVKAENLEGRLEKMMELIDTETNEEKKTDLLDSLKTRVMYTQAKLEGGLVNFGEIAEQISCKYELIRVLSNANALLALESAEGNAALDERLDKYMTFRGKKVSKKVHQAMRQGAVLGAAFATAGYIIAHMYSGGSSGGQTATESISQPGKGGQAEVFNKDTHDNVLGVQKNLAQIMDSTMRDTTDGGGVNEAITSGPSAVTENLVPIEKGGNLWNAARLLVEGKKISEKEFSDAWQHSTVKIDGHDIPISKVALVHEGDELQFVSDGKNGGHFEIFNKSGDPLGDERALYDIYVKKNSDAPEWLKDALGIKEKPPEEMMPDELAERLKDIHVEPADLARVLTKNTTGPIEIPSHITEALQADSFRRGLMNLYNEMETSAEDFGDQSLLGQETELQKYADFTSQVENYLAYKDRIPAWDMDGEALEKAQDAHRELCETFADHQKDFWSDLKKMGVTQEMYQKTFVEGKSKMTVDDFKSVVTNDEMHGKWMKFAKWVLEMKPKDGKMPLDEFIRANFKD